MFPAAVRRLLLPAAMLLLGWMCYRPGLSGGFLFDDYVNLDLLGFEDPLQGIDAFLRYLSGGRADPTGRPVALLSFLLDARTWPADPAPFLRTNLAIHLANGLLLFALLRRLGALLGDDESTRWRAAGLGAAMWLLHPLFVSTTLYAVQRQAMLPASFAMLGLLAWLHGRERLLAKGGGAGIGWMVAGIVGGSLLAGFSKANGFVLPLLVLALEWALPAGAGEAAATRRLRLLRGLLLWLPGLLLLGCLAIYGLDARQYAGRDFDLGQRLLSEARVLLDYLRLLWIPSAQSDGLFNDDFHASAGWLKPGSTLPAVLSVAALAGAGLWLRRRAPAWSMAILFFLAGHVVESSVLPLELHFEHRNYLPALLMFWPLARAIQRARFAPAARHGLSIALVLLLALLTWQRAQLWGHPERLASLWLAGHPDSSRAIAWASINLREAGQAGRALALLDSAWERSPLDAQVALNATELRCRAGGLRRGDLDRLARTLRGMRADTLVFPWLDNAIGPAPGFPCHLPDEEASALVDALAANPAFGYAGAVQNLQMLRARLALQRGDRAVAARHLQASLLADVRPEVAAAQAAVLMDAGYHGEAMAHLDFYDRISARAARPAFGMPRVHDWLLRRQGYWEEVFTNLRAAARERTRAP